MVIWLYDSNFLSTIQFYFQCYEIEWLIRLYIVCWIGWTGTLVCCSNRFFVGKLFDKFYWNRERDGFYGKSTSGMNEKLLLCKFKKIYQLFMFLFMSNFLVYGHSSRRFAWMPILRFKVAISRKNWISKCYLEIQTIFATSTSWYFFYNLGRSTGVWKNKDRGKDGCFFFYPYLFSFLLLPCRLVYILTVWHHVSFMFIDIISSLSNR